MSSSSDIPHSAFPIPHSWSRCPVLFEDAFLLAIDKPAGVLSHPNERGATREKVAFEGAYHPDDRRFDTPAGALWLLHRLDQDTSGVLLAAKSPEIARALRDSFESRAVEKQYFALVRGKPIPPVGSWRDHLAKHTGQGMVRSAIIPRKPPNAELHYKIRPAGPPIPSLPRNRQPCLLEIQLLTGRTHQIRVQAAHHHHPLAGDRIYGDFAWNRALRQEWALKRLFLHASQLKFPHPQKNTPLVIQAPLPADLKSCLGPQ